MIGMSNCIDFYSYTVSDTEASSVSCLCLVDDYSEGNSSILFVGTTAYKKPLCILR